MSEVQRISVASSSSQRREWSILAWCAAGAAGAFVTGGIAVLGGLVAGAGWFFVIALIAWPAAVLLGAVVAMVSITTVPPFSDFRRLLMVTFVVGATIATTVPWLISLFALGSTDYWVVAVMMLPGACFLAAVPRIERAAGPATIGSAAAPPAQRSSDAGMAAAVDLGPTVETLEMAAYKARGFRQAIWRHVTDPQDERSPARNMLTGLSDLALSTGSGLRAHTYVDVVIAEKGLAILGPKDWWSREPDQFRDTQLRWEDIESVELGRQIGNRCFYVNAPKAAYPVFTLLTWNRETFDKLLQALEGHGIDVRTTTGT